MTIVVVIIIDIIVVDTFVYVVVVVCLVDGFAIVVAAAGDRMIVGTSVACSSFLLFYLWTFPSQQMLCCRA